MSDFREDLLTSILDCGYGDLYLMEDCQYDIGEIVEECQFQFGKIDINLLVMTMFDYGIQGIEEAINDRLDELEDINKESGCLTKEEREEKEALEALEPFDDIQSFHNYIDTHIWVDRKDRVETYKKYLTVALDHFYEMTGFEIGTD